MCPLEDGPHPSFEWPLWRVDILLPEIGVSLASSNMSDINLDIQSKLTLNICGILENPWNTSSTCLPNILATYLSIVCTKEEDGSGVIWAMFLVGEDQFKTNLGFGVAGTMAQLCTRRKYDCNNYLHARFSTPSPQLSPLQFASPFLHPLYVQWDEISQLEKNLFVLL